VQPNKSLLRTCDAQQTIKLACDIAVTGETMWPRAAAKKRRDFDPHAFLATIGEGRKFVLFPKKQRIFAQGDTADAVFHIQAGKVRLTVVSNEARKQPLAYSGTASSSVKVRWQVNPSAWALQPQ
jgi:hypothetical protein